MITAIILKILGIITMISGVVNLYISFTDKWILLGGIATFLIGELLQQGTQKDYDEFIRKRQSGKKFKKGGFADRLNDALKEQRNNTQ